MSCPTYLHLGAVLMIVLTSTFTVLIAPSEACTSICVHPNATANGSAFVTYNADDSNAFGYLKFLPSANHESNTNRTIVDGDTRVVHGVIPEAAATFQVVHRANEYNVAIGESTFEGLESLATPYPGSIMDYESLIDLALQRAQSAIEAAGVITALAELYGYVSTGESFSIADQDEAYILEMIGKGPYAKGVVWALYRLPNATVSAHANQARITQCEEPNCMLHPDTLSFARSLGYTGTDKDFSFSDFFHPLEPATVRACEARVWSVFQKLTNGGMDQYLNYAQGWDLKNRMPLFVSPVVPVTREMLFDLMRDTYEGTFFAASDSDKYVGAGPYSSPYRARPLDFTAQGKRYVNERPIATQQTLTSQVAEVRRWNPNTDPSNLSRPYRTVVWFSLDDTLHSVRVPFYAGGITAIPKSYAVDSADVLSFSFDSAFWTANMVANLAYTAYSYISPEVQKAIAKKNAEISASFAALDQQIAALVYNPDASTLATQYCVTTGDNLTKEWLTLWQTLFMKYKDSYILTPASDPHTWQPISAFQAPPQSWQDRVAAESGRRFLIPSKGNKKLKAPGKGI